ncbi:hypothetical protein [Niveibacterium sp. SC-1]|uniref:hypothetical protein n=1 Tax=Niveibacterium sp. SC-1 TaxID=3135646 RepID=UPI00311F240B
MRRVLPLLSCLLCCLLLPAGAFAQTRLIWGEAEVIGLQTLKREDITSRLPFKVGAPMEEKEKEILGWCDKLRGSLKVLALKCSGAVEERTVHLVVEVIESADQSFGIRPSNAPAARARIAPEARQLLARREYRVQEMAAEGQTPSEAITPSGVIVADDPELRMFDAQLRETCFGRRADYVSIVLDPGSQERREALVLLSWTGEPETTIAAIHSRLLDPDPEIRNLTGRLILSFMSRIEDPQIAHDVAQSFVGQLQIPTHTDRTKAVLGLAQLVAAHPELRDLIADSARAPLEKLARESVLDNVGGQARALIARLRG